MPNQAGQQLIQKAGKLHSAGKFNQAEKIYTQLLAANPNDLTLIRLLGMLERDRRDLKASIHWFTLAKQVSGNDPVILAELSLSLEQAGKSQKAMEIAIEASEAAPEDISVAIFFAKMCLTRGLATQAASVLEQAIHSDLNNAEAWHLLSTAVNSSGILPVPLHYAQKSIQLNRNTAPPYTTLATAHRMNGNLNESLSSYNQALAIDETSSEAVAGKAEVLVSLGRIEDADNILKSTPPSHSVLVALAKVRVARLANKPKEALEAIDSVFNPSLSPFHTSHLLMHRGRALEELEQYDEAWGAWEEGNQLHSGSFDCTEHVKKVDSIIATQKGTSGLSDSTQPIFIIGMFRSGTTLLEQILGAHPDIDAAGEVNKILRFATEIPYPDCVSSPNTEWPQQYLDRLNSESPFCTDKMPMNYLHVGLIYSLFPNATIIHTTRNPLDTCISCFANSFTSSHAYTSNLSDLATVYEQYIRVMQHWTSMYPDQIYEVNYENLVANTEDTIAGVLSHIGVPFDKTVLEFYNVRRIAITPSADQVRKPIYDSSVNRRVHFSQHISELTRLQ